MNASNCSFVVLTQSWAVSGTPWNWSTAIFPCRACATAALKSSSVQVGRASPAVGIEQRVVQARLVGEPAALLVRVLRAARRGGRT